MVALLSLNDKKKKEYLDPDEIENEKDEDKKKTRKKFKFGIVTEIAVAVISVIAFVLTENMHYTMAWTDKWTLLMIVFAAVSIVAYIAVGKRHDNDDQEPETVTEG